MILIFPDGRIGGSTYSDSEWANTPSGSYERYVLDVARDVDRRFATIPDRLDVIHLFKVYPGGHSSALWGAQAPRIGSGWRSTP